MTSGTASPASSASLASLATTTAAVSTPLGFMEQLSDIVYLYRPPVAAVAPTASSAAPALVIVCSWMDAQPIHIAKYLAAYRDGLVFSGAAQPPALLLIRSNKAEVFTRIRGAAAVKPAVPVVQAFLSELQQKQDEHEPPRLLVHVFSNGGGIMLSHLYDALGASGDICLPRHVTVFDSCPGRFRYAGAVATMTVGLSRRPLPVRLVTLSVVHVLVASFWLRTRWRRLAGRLAVWLKGNSSSVAKPRKDSENVLDGAWEPHNETGGSNRNEVRRAYLYSRDDLLVAADDVEQHAVEARAHGFTVARMLQFPDSGHVTHARKDPAQYWRTVREVWAGDVEDDGKQLV